LLRRTDFEGLLEKGVNAVSPFQRFYAVLGGEADLLLILFDLTLAALTVFYAVYAVERRRWS
ncbi:MAG: ABC transporter, partial [Clostridia bacterium]|nr:ABC transporter [Clostridia bacterium]